MYIVNQLTLGSNQSPKVAANMERIDKGSFHAMQKIRENY